MEKGDRGIREEIDKGTGEGGIEGKGGGEREEETRDAPIRDLSNHQLKSTLMAPVEVKENVKKKKTGLWVLHINAKHPICRVC